MLCYFVTTAPLSPMCSSGYILNFGHSKPKIRMNEAWIGDVQAYCGIAAVDMYLDATQLRHNDPPTRTKTIDVGTIVWLRRAHGSCLLAYTFRQGVFCYQDFMRKETQI